VKGNLGHELTPFVGRSGELGDLAPLMGNRRLLTLTGAGGCGKTRLARRLVEVRTEDWPDGVWWIDLGPISDPDLVAPALADALGIWIEPGAGQLEGIVAHLRDSSLLVCLDTCEHLIDATALLANRILGNAPSVCILATSREPLGVPGETVYRVPPLNIAESVELFLDRAGRGDATFDLAPFDADIEHVCRRLEGMPLAIELAAAWVPSLTPHQIARGLDRNLGILGGGPRRAIPRHRALLASMDWSHDLLDPPEREVFRRLAVFAGTFSAEAVETVCASGDAEAENVHRPEPGGVLRGLINKSLVAVVPSGPNVRYRLLDTVRQYAEMRLRSAGEIETTRGRHLDLFVGMAEEARLGLELDQDPWRQALDLERGNLQAALSWGLTADPEGTGRGRQLAAALARYWFIRGQAHEGLDFLQRAIALDSSADSTLLARLYCGLAMLSIISGRVKLVEESAARAIELSLDARDLETHARSLALSSYPLFFADAAACESRCREVQQLGESTGEAFALDFAASISGYSLIRRDRHAEAVSVAQPPFHRSMARGERFCAGLARGVDQISMMFCGDVVGSVIAGQEILSIIEPLGNRYLLGTLATNVSLALGMSGDLEAGRRLMQPIVRAINEVPETDAVAYMYAIGRLYLWEGNLADARMWFERGLRQRETFTWTAVRCLAPMASVMRRLGHLDEAIALATQAATAAMTYDGPLALAEAWDEQARLAAPHDPAQTHDLHHQALSLRREHGLRTFYVDSLDALGASAATTGKAATAARLLAASDMARGDMGYPHPLVDHQSHAALVEGVRRNLGEEDFVRIWHEGTLLSLDDAVALATRGRGAQTRPTSGWASLTPTELDVVRLVSEGLSNPEIGARLFMSRSTVKTHLSHVYAKVGLSTRAGLAALASAQFAKDPGVNRTNT
jgi:predicted ATPase/DNA-binding CsgD family transcriptional regulator